MEILTPIFTGIFTVVLSIITILGIGFVGTRFSQLNITVNNTSCQIGIPDIFVCLLAGIIFLIPLVAEMLIIFAICYTRYRCKLSYAAQIDF